jgi:SAM-dependent methyltransferase
MTNADVRFTGGNFIPGLTEKRLHDDHLERYKFAAARVQGAKVLDIACGSGYGGNHMIQAGALSVDGVDIMEDIVAHAAKAYPDPRIRFHVGDIRTFRGDAPYDVITCYETIEHLTGYREAIDNLFSLLKPGGTLLISSPNRIITTPEARSIADRPSNPFHTQEFLVEELRALLEERGFKIGKGSIYGQRFQIRFRNKWLRKLYRMAFRPEAKADPAVLPLGNRAPRYFLIAAQAPA